MVVSLGVITKNHLTSEVSQRSRLTVFRHARDDGSVSRMLRNHPWDTSGAI